MADYRVHLTLRGPLATPLHSGTLFGHLCWAFRYQQGEAALTRWLAELPAAPLLLSDAFPTDQLPRPRLAPADRPAEQLGESRADFVNRMQHYKRLRKATWLTVADFLALRDQLNETHLLQRLAATAAVQPPPTAPRPETQHRRQAHNTIDRLTGTTPETGGLYFMDETWSNAAAAERDVYVRSEFTADQLQALFTQVGEFGFGRDATLGRGQFTVRIKTADPRLFAYQGNRLLSLSHGTLTANMAAPRYQRHTHFGKVGGLYGGGVMSPFKYPLGLLRPGATFSPTDDGPYGELLTGVHPDDSTICQHAWHLCLPFTETLA